jgi:hypothetical protein
MSVLAYSGTPITDPNFANELALEEALDALDPLRHFRYDDNDIQGHDPCDVSVLPMQPQSAIKQITNLSFGGHISGEYREQLSIKLAVDASPGCGGVAWPAGQVNHQLSYKRELSQIHPMSPRSLPNTSSD